MLAKQLNRNSINSPIIISPIVTNRHPKLKKKKKSKEKNRYYVFELKLQQEIEII